MAVLELVGGALLGAGLSKVSARLSRRDERRYQERQRELERDYERRERELEREYEQGERMRERQREAVRDLD